MFLITINQLPCMHKSFYYICQETILRSRKQNEYFQDFKFIIETFFIEECSYTKHKLKFIFIIIVGLC